MKRFFGIVFCILFISGAVFGAGDVLAEADRLYDLKENQKAIDLLTAALDKTSGNEAKAEIYWRLARHTLDLGDERKDDGASEGELLPIYEKGKAYADEAIRLDPNAHEGYYWKASNIGRWAQAKGILNALFEAKPMRDLLSVAVSIYPDHGDSWYVLGMLYEQVPGFPVSFGDKSFAVSLGRKSIDANKTELASGAIDTLKYVYYMELANHLWARDWNESKRKREQKKMSDLFKSTTDIMEKNFYYEGSINIENISDREEAKKILRWVIDELKALSNKTPGQVDDLKEAQNTLDSWGA